MKGKANVEDPLETFGVLCFLLFAILVVGVAVGLISSWIWGG